MNRVLIVEDHPLVADATSSLILEKFPNKHTTICRTASDTIQLLRNEGPTIDRILLDLDVPGATGLSLAMALWDMGCHRRCCILTGSERKGLMGQVRAKGFRGYLLKSMEITEYIAALRRFFDRSDGFIGASEYVDEIEPIRITHRQSEILAYVRDGYVSKQIASSLSLSVGTVDNHIASAASALGASNRSHAVSIAIQMGLLSAGQDRRGI